MRLLGIVAVVCAAALITPAIAAASGTVPMSLGGMSPGGGPGDAALPQAVKSIHFGSGAPSSPARATTGASISGSVKEFYAWPLMGATVTWWTPSGGTWLSGSATTSDPDGTYAFSGVPATAGSGELWLARPTPAVTWERGRYGMSWADGSSTTVDFQPGTVPLSIYRGDPGSKWDNAYAYVWTDPADGNGHGSSYLRIHDAYSAGDDGAYTTMDVEPGTGAGAAVYFWLNSGVDVPFTASVTAGTASGIGVEVYEDSATLFRTFGSLWDSGKPGKRINVDLHPIELSSVWQFRAQSDYPAEAAWTDLSVITANENEALVSVLVPRTAKPGYFCWLAADHVNGVGALHLVYPFQVCTLNASRTSISRGTAIRVSGIVPVNGHRGTHPGTPKTVSLYRALNYQSQPRSWKPNGYTWKFVTTMRTDGYGHFRSPRIKLAHTSSLVVRYPGDATYWRAYTTPVTVKVK